MERRQVLQAVYDIAGVPVTPQQHGWKARGRHVPAEQAGPILSLEPNLPQGKPAEASPIPVLPPRGMVDPELVKHGTPSSQKQTCTDNTASLSRLRWLNSSRR